MKPEETSRTNQLTTDWLEAELEALHRAYEEHSNESFALAQGNKALESAATRLEAQQN